MEVKVRTIGIDQIKNRLKNIHTEYRVKEMILAQQVVTEAKIKAESYRDTGNYINQIKREGNKAVANAVYSAKLEYVPNSKSGSKPYATMRKSARDVAKRNNATYRVK